jgi:hypothetical protein
MDALENDEALLARIGDMMDMVSIDMQETTNRCNYLDIVKPHCVLAEHALYLAIARSGYWPILTARIVHAVTCDLAFAQFDAASFMLRITRYFEATPFPPPTSHAIAQFVAGKRRSISGM